MSDPLLRVRGLNVRFPVRTGGMIVPQYTPLKAVSDVSFDLRAGETLGIVGESGCGKSSLARALIKLVKPSEGEIVWMGRDVVPLADREMDAQRDTMQIVFQDPLSSHNPRMNVGAIVGEPLTIFRKELNAEARRAAVLAMLEQVGLSAPFANRYPHELSGGQAQRVSIARAMILRPKLLVCDEPVSALDVSTQAQIINLIKQVQCETRVAVIFISHDLSVVRYVCERILVMYLGRVVELGVREALFARPAHPYTKALLAAIPVPDPKQQRGRMRALIKGELPSPLDPPSGCVFRTRCPKASPACIKSFPEMEPAAEGHAVACHHWRDS
jgi:oligopeptide transport system ATP-binding protein